MNTSFTIFLVLIAIVCFLLIVVIMVQNPKGGGLDSSFGGSTVAGGVKNTNDFLDKSTWFLGAALIVLILMSSLSTGGGVSGDSKLLDQNAVIPTATTNPSTETPVEQAPASDNQQAE
ncbi:preprotein translocase subunit SecG [Myroides pelagicus]|uniref:Protein-export membrane protein SecG n=1 Tax=Myroides pelagicus TaxID=270914 RepID=A0A7K1GNR9_9FLAO|nr:preprotein translocase subunit SecG [Myroides pelagicus]MEC4114496.1 preprotein translocase subunit SecG [Myroides pelagicus]MTH30552.1 preprotein translocase subunit SecG [Myroides pelagicus]